MRKKSEKLTKRSKFLLDENIPSFLHEMLRDKKRNVRTVGELGLNGQEDNSIWQKSRQDERVLITIDPDFTEDKKFSLHLSPGIFILSSAEDKVILNAFRFLSWRWDWHGTKLLIHPEIILFRHIKDGKICEEKYQCRKGKRRIPLTSLE